ncbi:MAG: hypothetical protein IJO10_04225 [Clostridia bacterium]|nr:hypothetical protein [Clostridia bacterium]
MIAELRGAFVRRKTDRYTVKVSRWLIILASLCVLFGVFCVVLPHIAPRVSYDSLQMKEVTISKFKHHYGGRTGASYDYIRTTDGEKFNLSGDYQREQLQELLTEGKTATVKWYKNEPFWTLLVEEMYVDGERVVTYDNDKPISWKPPLIVGSCYIVLGIGCFLCFLLFMKTNRKRRKKRDKKTQRNYGNKAE